MPGKISVHKITLIALAIVINIVGSYIALGLHLPVYLDSMGRDIILSIRKLSYKQLTAVIMFLCDISDY